MVVPAEAFKFEVPMDPAEILDYEMKLQESPQLLEEGELYTSWTLTLYPEAIALGLEIGAAEYAPVADGTDLIIWFQVDPAFQEDPAWDGDGTDLPMELTLETNNVPPRKRQRTIILPMRQL